MAISASDTKSVLAKLRAIHIETERDVELRRQLDRLLDVGDKGANSVHPVRFAGGLETRGIAMIEPAGGGKTTAVQNVLASYPALQDNPDTGRPRYLHAQVESPATQKSLGIAILRELGIDRISERAKVWEIWDMVRHRLALNGIIVLWIDEAHDLFGKCRDREVDRMLKMLKSLMQGEGAVIVLLSGTERLGQMTSVDPQVSRRFVKIVPSSLEPGAHTDSLGKMIAAYCEVAGLAFRPERDLVHRLIYGSRNRFGRAIETSINAIEVALERGADTLKPDDFAEAWGMGESCAWSDNVFVAHHWRDLDLDPLEDDPSEFRSGNGRKHSRRKG